MKFLCDVHISYKIVNFLNSSGFETIHINQVLDKWFTKDRDICKYADKHDYILITKDQDFRNSHFIRKTPKKLIKVNLGNISNQELIYLLKENIPALIVLYSEAGFLIEIEKKHITFIKWE